MIFLIELNTVLYCNKFYIKTKQTFQSTISNFFFHLDYVFIYFRAKINEPRVKKIGLGMNIEWKSSINMLIINNAETITF